ncbi:MAG: hypothetical protein ABIH00_05430 [Armatimonadota bacterium]
MKVASRPGKYSSVLFYLFVNDEDTPRFLLKVNRTPGYFTAIENEYNNLRYVYGKFKEGLPQPIFCEKSADNIIFCETFLKGEQQKKKINSSNVVNWEDISFYLEAGLKWLLEFQEATKNTGFVIDDAWIKENIFNELDKFLKENPAVDLLLREKLINIAELIYKHKGVTVPRAVSQGDFDQWNILVDRSKVNVVDWEECVIKNSVYDDFFMLVFHFAMLYNSGRSEKDNFNEFFTPSGRGYNIFSKMLNTFSKQHKLPTELFFVLAPFYVIKAVNKKYPEYRDPVSMPLNSLKALGFVTDLSWRELNAGKN